MKVIGEGDGLSFQPKGIRALKTDNSNSTPVIFDLIAKEFSEEINFKPDRTP